MVVVVIKEMLFYFKKKIKNKESRCVKFLKFYSDSGICFFLIIRYLISK